MEVSIDRYVEKTVVLERFLQGPRGPVQSDMRRRTQIVHTLAKGQVGVRTGALKRSIIMGSARTATGLVWFVGSENHIALLHHQGSRPHMIYPNRARVLRFKVRGSVIYARAVRHPGTRPNRYLSDQLRKIVDIV